VDDGTKAHLLRGKSTGNLTGALQQLRAERKQAQARVESIDQAIFSDRVVKWYGNIRENKAADANISGVTSQDGAGTKGKMGAYSEGIAPGSSDNEKNGVGYCEAHHVSINPQEDCGRRGGRR
jgi:hypothetical protein